MDSTDEILVVVFFTEKDIDMIARAALFIDANAKTEEDDALAESLFVLADEMQNTADLAHEDDGVMEEYSVEVMNEIITEHISRL